MIIHGGRAIYGESVGILVLDSSAPFNLNKPDVYFEPAFNLF